MRITRCILGLAVLSLCLLYMAGCYSVPADSDIPWNAPQGWEGSPHIPGFSAD